MLRFKMKNIDISRFLVFFVLSLTVCLTLAACGGGGGGGGGGARSATSYVVDYGGGSNSPDPVPAPTTAPLNTTGSYAMFVGISDYPGTINDLPYASKDASDVCTRLRTSSVWSNGTIKTLSNSSATKSAIRAAIEEAKNTLANGGTFLFYYSGHGTNSGSLGYIVPYDGIAEAGGVVMNGLISANELYSYLSELPANVKKYVLIDSCRSGYFIDAKALLIDEYHKPKFVAMDTSSRLYDDGLFTKSLTSLSNCSVLTSSKGSELSWESGYLQNGVFTYYLCQGLGINNTGGPADTNSSGTISAEELASYVPSKVNAYITANVSGYTQIPQAYDGIEGEFRVK